MQAIEEENTSSAVEAASLAEDRPRRVLPQSDEKCRKEAIVSEIPEKKTSEVDAPVDSVGDDAGEALAYETVAKAAAAPEAAPASTPAIPAVQPPAPPQAQDEPQHITIDDFTKVELRVAQILVAERIPKADKLLRLEVDLATKSARFWPASLSTTSRKSSSAAKSSSSPTSLPAR